MTEFFQHPTAIVESEQIGAGTRIWAYAHVMRGAIIGENCNLGDHSFVESGAVLGNNVTVKNGVAIWDQVQVGDGVFLGPNAALTNDLWPRSRKPDWQIVPTIIEAGVTIGANATIVCGITIGTYAMIGAGAVVTRDVPAYALCYGNPAKVRGWVCQCGNKLLLKQNSAQCTQCGQHYLKQSNGIALSAG
jgi:UDP-2-acetamido-3-amino-2,3-dideoxy-glucuronate N-acetyltransferase